MNFTQEQIDTIQLPIRGKHIKLEVLNTDFQTLATLEGNAIGGELQKDANGFERRSGSIQLCVPNIANATTFLEYINGITVNINGKIWLDKYIKVWIGIDNYIQPYGVAPKTVWYNFGICLIDQPVRTFSADGYTMTFNVIDLAAKMNGDRSGQLAVSTTLFPRVQGYDTNNQPIYTKTEDALASCISELTEFKRFTIYPIPQKWATLPYDIKMEVGATVYSALEQFLNILNGWQMYFDNDGIFVVEPIPSGANDIVYPLNLQLNTQDVNSVDFNNVRNQVIVYGRSHNIDIYTEDSEWTFQGELKLNFQELDTTKIQVGSTIFGWDNSIYMSGGIVYGLNVSDITISINGTDLFTANIYNYGNTSSVDNLGNGVYVFRIKTATTTTQGDLTVIDFTKAITLEFLGRQQAQACVVNGNPESPYYIAKNYKTTAYYGESTYSFGQFAGEQRNFYDIYLTSDTTSLFAGDIICFFTKNVSADADIYFRIYNKNETYIIVAIANVSYNQFGGDYTIWSFRYNGTSFDFFGRCPYANTLVESGGEFDNIYADVLAQERAKYDLFLHTNMQNTITLSCVPDYSIDVNYRIKYNQGVSLPPDTGVVDVFDDRYFITKTITYPLGMDGSAQTINAIEIYDDYNYVGYAYDSPSGT